MLDPIHSAVSSFNAYSVAPSVDNERAESIPDDETAELRKKAPIEGFKGLNIDMEA